MIEGLKPYAEYKESGLPWFPRIPTHWKVGRLKSFLIRNDAGVWSDAADERGTVVLRSTEQTVDGRWKIDHPAKILLSPCQREGAKLAAGDLVVTKSSGSPLHIGKTTLVNREIAELGCCFSNFMQRLRVNSSTNSELVWRMLNSAVGRMQFVFQTTTTTGLGNLNGTILGLCWFPFATPDEQAAIVRFLDHANRKIDGFIRAKRKLIGLLNEQKQAIIHRAVTRGLHPDVPLKPSGIPWLGDIPMHWEVRRAKYLFREVDDRSKEGKEMHLAMSQRLGLVPSSMVESAMRSESYAGAKLCREGDLVLNRLKAHLGVFALAKQGGVISPDYSVFRKRAAISMEYYESVLKSSACRRELRIRAKGLVEGFWRLYTDDFYDIRLPVPPLDEQKEIMSAMAVETAALTTAIARTEREIALMQEYRTRLTADLVTGKLDVREAAANLPATIDDGNAQESSNEISEGSEEEILEA
jgi:type I restriction enzyme S subunit